MNEEIKQQLRDRGYIEEFDLISLIEVCGNDFHNLQLNTWVDNEPAPGKWSAFNHELSDNPIKWKEGEKRYTLGSTPEEAVALLWIRLNDKTN